MLEQLLLPPSPTSQQKMFQLNNKQAQLFFTLNDLGHHNQKDPFVDAIQDHALSSACPPRFQLSCDRLLCGHNVLHPEAHCGLVQAMTSDAHIDWNHMEFVGCCQ